MVAGLCAVRSGVPSLQNSPLLRSPSAHRAVNPRRLQVLIHKPLHDSSIPVVTAQVGIAACGKHLDHTAANLRGFGTKGVVLITNTLARLQTGADL